VVVAEGEKVAVFVVEEPELQAYELKPAVAVKDTDEPVQTIALEGEEVMEIAGGVHKADADILTSSILQFAVLAEAVPVPAEP
jgi:hypothetical protein